jgi:predicted RNA-binding Zn ribbon-like protein
MMWPMELLPWVSDEEDKPAPMPLLRVQAFINTRDLEKRTDLLSEPGPATRWLAAAGLIAPGVDVSAEQLQEAREVRECLRGLVGRNGGTVAEEDEYRALQAIAERRRAQVSVAPGGKILLSAEGDGDLADGLLGLMLTVRDAQLDGTWERLKLCANPDCSWAFYDRSRNRQGSWCTMAVCGNRLKNRRFRARAAE